MSAYLSPSPDFGVGNSQVVEDEINVPIALSAFTDNTVKSLQGVL